MLTFFLRLFVLFWASICVKLGYPNWKYFYTTGVGLSGSDYLVGKSKTLIRRSKNGT